MKKKVAIRKITEKEGYRWLWDRLIARNTLLKDVYVLLKILGAKLCLVDEEEL